MKKLILGLIVICQTSQLFSQIVDLPEVEITATNYKYISAVDSDDLDFNVKMLEKEAATFDFKNSDMYTDLDPSNDVTFDIPNGAMLVAYNRRGEIIRTTERFKNVKLPLVVRNAISQKYPEWGLKKDVYRVTYRKDQCNKVYKIILEKENKVLKVKIDEKGNFIENKSLKVSL